MNDLIIDEQTGETNFISQQAIDGARKGRKIRREQ